MMCLGPQMELQHLISLMELCSTPNRSPTQSLTTSLLLWPPAKRQPGRWQQCLLVTSGQTILLLQIKNPKFVLRVCA